MQKAHRIETSNHFKKIEKLKSRKKIDSLFSKGKSFSNFPFKVLYSIEKDNRLIQAGFAVSSRHFKKAVHRNRIKRLMRESYRLQKSILSADSSTQAGLCIFFIYTGKSIPEYKEVFEKIGASIQRLNKLIHEAGTLHT